VNGNRRSSRLPWTILGSGVVVVILLGVLIAAVSHTSGGASGDDPNARLSTDAQSVAYVLGNDVQDRSATGLARAVDSSWANTVLVARGDVSRGGVTLVVRLTANGQSEVGDVISATGCFDYLVQRYDAPPFQMVPCPHTAPLVVPPVPTLPDLTDSAPAAIAALPPADRLSPDAIRDAVARLAPGASVTVTTDDGAIGVALSVPSAQPVECELIRLDHGIQVWFPPAVLAQRGADGCTAQDAALGLETEPPH
jgi:hypothetical protein